MNWAYSHKITRSVCISASLHCWSSSSESRWERMAVEESLVRSCPICGWKGFHSSHWEPTLCAELGRGCACLWPRLQLLCTTSGWHVCCLNVDILQTSWNPGIHKVTLQSYNYKYCNTCLLRSKLNEKKKDFLKLISEWAFCRFFTKSNHQIYPFSSH